MSYKLIVGVQFDGHIECLHVYIYIYITDRRVAGKSSSVYTSNQQDIGIICGHVDEQSSSRGPKPSTYTPIVKVIGLVKNTYFHLMPFSSKL